MARPDSGIMWKTVQGAEILQADSVFFGNAGQILSRTNPVFLCILRGRLGPEVLHEDLFFPRGGG
jgi:hypothetical protein